jgi:hypothetical protein
VGVRLYQPYRLSVRFALWLWWAAIALGVLYFGSRSSQPNHPAGLLLLGLGLAASGILALLTLASSVLWERLVDPEFDVRRARSRLYWMLGVGLIGIAMLWAALHRLL